MKSKVNHIQAINFINLFHICRDERNSKNEGKSRETGS